jgi:hypothetical protein
MGYLAIARLEEVLGDGIRGVLLVFMNQILD